MLKPEYNVVTFLQTSVNIFHSTCPDIPGDISLKDIDCRLVMLSVLTIKQIVYYVKNTTILYNFWYFVMATYFGPSLDHPRAHTVQVRTDCTSYLRTVA